MKKAICTAVLALVMGMHTARAQSHEAEQLALNIAKLAQLKQILDQMYRGYVILNMGYSTVRDITKGNFNLHRTFLDGLLLVSPGVRDYPGVAAAIRCQQDILLEYRRAYQRLVSSGLFAPGELGHIGKVYGGLFDGSLQNLAELVLVLTAGQARMGDAERLEAIDRIRADMEGKLVFLRGFNRRADALASQRLRAREYVRQARSLHGQ